MGSDWRGTKKAGLLELEVGELLITLELDEERNTQDEKCSSGNPKGFSGAPNQLLPHESAIRGELLSLLKDGGFGDGG